MDYHSVQLLIIGNGFDLSLGLKTSYNDFINSDEYNSLDKSHNFIKWIDQRSKINKWIDLENEMTFYGLNKKNMIDKTRHQVDVSKEKEGFTALRVALMSYLSSIDYSTIGIESAAYKLFKSFMKESGKKVIIDFNYTDSISILCEDYPSHSLSHEKVHGSIKDENIIMGVEDEAEVFNNYYKKSYPSYYPGVDISKYLDEAYGDITFFGYSLGQTDHSYFKEFFSSLANKHEERHHKSINMYYYDNDASDAINDQLYPLTNNKVKDFKSYNNFKMIQVSDIK